MIEKHCNIFLMLFRFEVGTTNDLDRTNLNDLLLPYMFTRIVAIGGYYCNQRAGDLIETNGSVSIFLPHCSTLSMMAPSPMNSWLHLMSSSSGVGTHPLPSLSPSHCRVINSRCYKLTPPTAMVSKGSLALLVHILDRVFICLLVHKIFPNILSVSNFNLTN